MLRTLTALVAGAVAVAAAAAAPAGAQEPAEGGTLRYGMVTEVSSLDPHVYVGSSWKVLTMAVYDSLLSFDAEATLQPGLAERWETPDPQTFIFHLRPDVRFHGGQALTAEDVRYSLARIQNEETGATLRANLEGATITVVDELTVRIETAEPDVTLLNILAMPETTIVSRAWMESGPNVNVEANGTGPFRLTDYEPGVRAIMERSPDYWRDGLPYLDRVEFQMINNADARVNALRTGGVDMIEFVPWKDIDNLAEQPGIEVATAGGAFMNIWINATRAPFDDPAVRRAMAFAIDREAISEAAFFGHGTPLYGPPTTPDSPFYNEDLADSFAYDPDRARALLAEAGHADGFAAELIVYQGLPIYTTTAQIVQANLQDVGIDTEIRLVEWASVVESKDQAAYDLMIYGVSVKLPDPDAYAYYFGAESTYWANPIGFDDAQLEDLLARGRALTDLDERRAVYAEAERRIVELAPWVFINWREQAQAYTDAVHGYVQLGGALSEASPGIVLPRLWLEQ